jgi:hypothetical protein
MLNLFRKSQPVVEPRWDDSIEVPMLDGSRKIIGSLVYRIDGDAFYRYNYVCIRRVDTNEEIAVYNKGYTPPLKISVGYEMLEDFLRQGIKDYLDLLQAEQDAFLEEKRLFAETVLKTNC